MTKLMNRSLAAKLISIFFAMILWLYVMSVINPRVTQEVMNVPVELVNEAVIRQSGLVVYGSPEPTIRVRLTGSRDQVHRVSRENIDARVDLRGYDVGINSIPIEVIVPGGVDVDWSPKFATIELEQIISKQKEVTIEVDGQPAAGFVLGEPQIRPSQVWIEGPESVVNSVDRIMAQLILDGQQENISLSLPLRAVNSRGDEVTQVDVRTSFVDVFAPVDRLKSVGVDVDMSLEVADGFQVVSIATDPVNITIRGQEQLLEQISRLQTEQLVMENLSESVETRVNVILPEGVSAFDQRQVNVRIEVEAVIEETYEVDWEQIRLLNLDPRLQVVEESLPEIIEVTVTGLESAIRNMNSRALQVHLDMDGLAEGTHQVRPVAQLPMNMESLSVVASVIPEEVTIQLEQAQ